MADLSAGPAPKPATSLFVTPAQVRKRHRQGTIPCRCRKGAKLRPHMLGRNHTKGSIRLPDGSDFRCGHQTLGQSDIGQISGVFPPLIHLISQGGGPRPKGDLPPRPGKMDRQGCAPGASAEDHHMAKGIHISAITHHTFRPFRPAPRVVAVVVSSSGQRARGAKRWASPWAGPAPARTMAAPA